MHRISTSVLIAAITAACAAPFEPTPTLTQQPPPPGIVAPTVPTELRIWQTHGIFAGGATTIKLSALGVASDGTMRGVPNLPIQWTTSAGQLVPVPPMTDHTDAAGFAAIVLKADRTLGDTIVDLRAVIAGRTLTLRVEVFPAGSNTPPPPPPPTGPGIPPGTGG